MVPNFSAGESKYQLQIFVDDKQVYKDVNEKFGILIERKQEYADIGYAIINDYLFIKRDNKLEYTKMFPLKETLVEADEINLQLDTDAEIKMLLPTEKVKDIYLDLAVQQGIHHPDIVQIIFTDYSDIKGNYILYIANWDLEKNIEYNMLQIQGASSNFSTYCDRLVCKGISEKLNYIVTNDAFYDLQYMLPMTFLTT